MTHICVVELDHHWFRQWLVTCSAPSHYLNQCWNIVNWTFSNKLQWNFNQNSTIFIQDIVFKNVVCKMASILSRPQWVKRAALIRQSKCETSYHNDDETKLPLFCRRHPLSCFPERSYISTRMSLYDYNSYKAALTELMDRRLKSTRHYWNQECAVN